MAVKHCLTHLSISPRLQEQEEALSHSINYSPSKILGIAIELTVPRYRLFTPFIFQDSNAVFPKV
jgi:hypothetical protein